MVKLLFDTIAEEETNKTTILNNTMAMLNQPPGDNAIKPIHAAAMSNDKGDEIIREILSRIVKVYEDVPQAQAPAPAAVKDALTQQLLTNRGTERQTALHLACKEGNVDAVKEILGFVKKFNEGKPDAGKVDFAQIINAKAEQDKTPLIIATENNIKSVVKVLIAEGADKTIRTSNNEIAETIAVQKHFGDIRDLLVQQQGGSYGAEGILGLSAVAYTRGQKLLPDIPVNTSALAGGNLCDKVPQDVPVLVKGEAELLNDLNLTPTNMKEIFSPENNYANSFNYSSLKSWGAAIEMFFRNLTVQKCYENRLLLTTSECEEAKCFLYSIRDYLENPMNETEVRKKFLNDGDTADINDASLEDDNEVQLSKISIAEPQYSISDGKPMVRVGAIEKSTNLRVHFNLKLSTDSENKGQRYPTDAEIEELKELFEKKQMQYKNKYVMYLY